MGGEFIFVTGAALLSKSLRARAITAVFFCRLLALRLKVAGASWTLM